MDLLGVASSLGKCRWFEATWGTGIARHEMSDRATHSSFCGEQKGGSAVCESRVKRPKFNALGGRLDFA